MRHKKQITGARIARRTCGILIAVAALSVCPGSTTGQGEKKISVADAEKRIEVHTKYIENRKREMTASYYYTGAKNTLEAAFKKAGVKWAMGYAKDWGEMGIGLTWSETASEYYSYHLNVLTESLRIIREQGYAKESDLAYLDRGMEAWKQPEPEFPKQFQTMVDSYTQRALVLDKKNDSLNSVRADIGRLEKMDPRRVPSGEIDRLRGVMDAYEKYYEGVEKKGNEDLQKVKDKIRELAAKHMFSVINDDKGCANGTERVRKDLKQTKKWVLAESIEFTKGSAAYIESDKKVLKTLTTAGEVIDKIGGIAQEDEFPIMKIPMEYFKGIVKAGNEIVQAGGRLSAQAKNKVVDLAVKIDPVEVSVECAPVEVCEKGKWVRKGYKQIGEPTKKKLSPVVKEEQGVLVGELWQRIDKYTRSYAVLQERYEANPCDGVAQAPDQVQPTPVSKEDCDKLLENIDRLKKTKTAVETKDLPALNQDLENAKKALEEWNRDLDKRKEQAAIVLNNADREVTRVKAKLNQEKRHKEQLEALPNVPTKEAFEDNIAKAKERIAKAEPAVTLAENDLADKKKRRANLYEQTAKLEQDIEKIKSRIADSKQRAADLQNEINALQKDYEKCKR